MFWSLELSRPIVLLSYAGGGGGGYGWCLGALMTSYADIQPMLPVLA